MNVFTHYRFARITRRSFGVGLCALFPIFGAVASQLSPDVDGLPRLASYTGTYEISLVRASQLEGVRAATGKMVYTLVDRCEGYTIETDVDVNLTFSNGLTNRVLKRYAGWEAKDGRRSTFRMQVYENGELEDSYTGKVDIAADGSGRALYASGETTTIDLPPGTVLSSQQLRSLIQAGQGATALFSQTVMDGAFEDGPYRTTGYIAPARDAGQSNEKNGPDSDVADLMDGAAWPVTMAYFPVGETAEVPEYELSFQLLPNGVIRSLTQDYGAYTLSMQLKSISPRAGGCS